MASQGVGHVHTPYVMRSPSRNYQGRPPRYAETDAEEVTLTLNTGGKGAAEKLGARIVPESPAFLMPEDQISVDMVQRSFDEDLREFTFKDGPLYLSTCYDEFSRNFPTANVAKNASPSVNLIKFGTPQPSGDDHDYDFDSSVLVPYYPVLSDWFSTFRKVPDDNAHLLSGKVVTDTNLLIRLLRCTVKQKMFEPIFGTACVYTIIDEEIYRVTETLSFDATPESIRQQYGMVYNENERDNPVRASNSRGRYTGCNVNVGDCSGAQSHLHMFNAVIPEELNFRDLFLVVQLSKILTSDQDKAQQPYLQRNPPPEMNKHMEACMRLSRFQQPLGIGIVKISDESNKIGMLSNGKTNFEVTFQFYCQKNSLSDSGIHTAIRELYPTEGQPYIRMDPMEIEMKVQIIDLGQEHQMVEHLMQSVKAFTRGVGVVPNQSTSGKGSESSGSRSNSIDVQPQYPITPIIIPRQFQSNTATLQYAVDYSTMEPYDRVTASLAVRQLTTLLPLASMTSATNLSASTGTSAISTVAAITSGRGPTSSAEFGGLTRQVKASVENTLFVYPLLCDKFSSKFRNLSLKFQLVEFKKDQPKSLMTAGAYTVLPAIYNTGSIIGPVFTTASYTKVSYHLKCPVFSEEIKIRLPDIVTTRHWLKITVVHVHVKPNAQRGSLLNSMMRSSVDTKQISDRAFTDVGVGFIPLMVNGESLIDDQDHSIKIYGTTDGDAVTPGGGSGHSSAPVAGDRSAQVTSSTSVVEGMVGIRTRAITSLVSTDRRVQSALRCQPVPLGVLPSSIMPPQVASLIQDRAIASPPKEMKLLQVTADLNKASSLELSRHFYVLMRQLIRTMLGGCGNYSEQLSNPYKHSQTRCQAFLTLLQVIGKIANDATAPSASSEMSLEKQFLHAYVEYMFDEEVPIELDDQQKTLVREQSAKFLSLSKANAKQAADVPSNNSSKNNLTDNSGGDASISVNAADNSRPVSPSEVALSTDDRASEEARSDKDKSPSSSPRSTRGGENSVAKEQVEEEEQEENKSSSSIPLSARKDRHAGEKETAFKIANEVVAIVKQGKPEAKANLPRADEEETPRASEDEQQQQQDDPSSSEVFPMKSTDSAYELSNITTSADINNRSDACMRMPNLGSSSANSPPSKSMTDVTEAEAEVDVEPEAEADETLEKMTRNLSTPGGDEKSPKEITALMSSAERKSWGKFITDSLFLSSPLPAIGIAGLSKDSSSETSEAISARYLDDIAAHIVLQMEKVVVERQINHAVYAISSELQYNSLQQQVTGDADDPQRVTADIVLAGRRYRTSNQINGLMNVEDLNPFKEERSWFSAVDSGKEADESDIYVVNSQSIVSKLNHDHGSVRDSRAGSTQDSSSNNSNSRRASRNYDINTEAATAAAVATSAKGGLLNPVTQPELGSVLLSAVVSAAAESSYNAKDVGLGQVLIEPILPMYDTIDGFRNRMSRIKDPQKSGLKSSYSHWWPWLYEVLVFQWGAVLTITLSSIHLISSNNTQSMIGQYPYDADLRQQSASNRIPKPDSIRSLLTEHCPVLLKLIFKSLVMRIKREHKRPPVQLDSQFLSALENLVMLLAVESATFSCGLWRSRKMVASLAAFLRSLFAVACPAQVIRLIRSFFRASRRNKKVEEAELRLQMVEEIGLFDHFVAANFPYALDAPIGSFTFRLVAPTAPPNSLYGVSAYTPAGIRGTTNPTPYLLAHTLINEVIVSYRQDERKVKDAALEVIRDLLVRHSYDARYQTLVAQQRVVCMYLPLLRELLKEKDRIETLAFDSSQRKEILVIIIYLLHCMPDRLLREYIREICKISNPAVQPGSSQYSSLAAGIASNSESNSSSNTLQLQSQSPPLNGRSAGSRLSFTSTRSSPRIVSLKADKTLANPSSKSFIPSTVHQYVEVSNMLMLMHCILDTFECPRIESTGTNSGSGSAAGDFSSKPRSNTTAAPPAPGTLTSPTITPTHASMAVTSVATAGAAAAGKNLAGDVLASGVHLEGTSEALKLTGLNLVRRNSNTDATSGAAGAPLVPPTPSKASNATALVNKLDQRLLNKKAATGAQARRGSASAKGEERQWVVNARRNATAQSGTGTDTGNEKYVLSSALSRSQQNAAAQQLCCSASRTVIQLLLVMFEECPPLLTEQDKSSSKAAAAAAAAANTPAAAAGGGEDNKDIAEEVNLEEVEFILRDSNIDECMLVGIKNLRVVYFMRLATTVVLHALYCNQEDAVVMKLFRTASIVIRNFGAKVFLVAVEDSLQDWMRVSFYHCASQNEAVSDTASNFILYMLRACFHYLGSATLVSNTVLAVINDVIEAILDNNQPLIRTHSDEDKILSCLHNGVLKMKAAAQQNISTQVSVAPAAAATDSINNSNSDSSTGSESKVAMPKLGPSCTAAFCKSVVTLMSNLELIFLANADLRRHVSHPVGYDFLGANMLDGPWDERIASLIHNQRFKRRKVERDPTDKGGKQAPISGFQLEEVMMHFVQAAEVYDPYKLPRFHMCWLENLARLHKLNGNKAESAEIRWRIFLLCQSVEDSWMQQWVPRPPLAWTRRGVEDSASAGGGSSGGGAGFVARGSVGGGEVSNIGQVPIASTGLGGITGFGTLKANGSIQVSGRNFYAVLLAALDGRPYRCWSDYQQYLTHMDTALTVSIEEFCSTNLIHLAERSAFRKVHLYRLLRKPELMLKEYELFVKQMQNIVSRGITSSMAIGTFYRVLYEGVGSPPHLRGKEFICRNANHVRVAEFESLLSSHLRSIVKDGVDIVIVADIRSAKELNNPSKAYIVMNSVKLIMHKSAKLSVRAMNNTAGLGMSGYRTMSAIGKESSAMQKEGSDAGDEMESLNQVRYFKYSVPFTLTGKSQAKTIDQQWKRSTILTVKEPFPYIMTRQLVFHREIRTYCPIEVAINDIEEKIEDMEAELEKQTNADTNNLMRIIQGCVLPQVNAGVGEVAKVFLSPNRVLSDNVKELLQREKSRRWNNVDDLNDQGDRTRTASEAAAAATTGAVQGQSKEGSSSGGNGGFIIGNAELDAADAHEIIAQQKKSKELVLRLKITLIDFLNCSRLLLTKARQILLTPFEDSAMSSAGSGNSNAGGNSGQRNSVASGGSGSNSGGGGNGSGGGGSGTAAGGAAAVDPHHEHLKIWQEEMEKGYDNLKHSIMPYLTDLNNSDLLMGLK